MSDRLAEERLPRIVKQVAQAQRNNETTERMREQANLLEVEGVSKGDKAAVVVDAAGHVRDVRFTAVNRVFNPPQLPVVVMKAIDIGRRDAATKIHTIVDRHVGADMGLGQTMLEVYE